MIQVKFHKHTLRFNMSGGTSRGVLHTKDSWIISLCDRKKAIVGTGECSIIPRLSIDDVPELEETVAQTVEQLNTQFQQNKTASVREIICKTTDTLVHFPSIRFALEMALIDWENNGRALFFPSDFTAGKAPISINGLIWMGNFNSMWTQAKEKWEAGFRVLKMKIGALNFDEELYFIKHLRQSFPQAELRLDANGAFLPEEASERLQALAQFDIHSIEQPVGQGNIALMAELCRKSPIAIALDEELIGIFSLEEKYKLLSVIQPQYIILKPSLLGGFATADEWIELAEKHNISWWATSALESNIGLNAIAQWTFVKQNPLPQGLGTGNVFNNNIDVKIGEEKRTLKLANGELHCAV